jgi:D-arabinose 1-dehydrogenase-like Zn-dependent alcohol dehydrogenase
MRILIAGASGAIGRPLVRRLKANQHEVFALTKSRDSAPALKEIGAEPVIADALDAAAVKAAVGQIRPDAVINELTSLPRHYTPAEMRAAAERDRKVRVGQHEPACGASRCGCAPVQHRRRKPVASALVADGVRACCRSTCATSRQRRRGASSVRPRRGLLRDEA